MKRFTWLYPGMHVKRWVLLIFAGLFMIAFSFAEELTGFKEALLGAQPRDYVNLLLLGGGLIVVLIGISRLTGSVITQVAPGKGNLVDIVYRQRLLKKGPKVVAIGGGTGLPVVLRGIKEFTSNITAVVAVSDDGGSSGKLRKDMNIPPPGDIRNCLIALADAEPLMGKLFQYRFGEEANISGHNFGNLFIAALTSVVGDFEEAVRQSCKILSIRGRVIPVTTANIRLKAFFTDGTDIIGEAQIPRQRKTIERLELLPGDCRVNPEVSAQIAEADIIIMGPGSLYTSVIPNLLVKGMPEAITRSRALKIYVSNIMTQPGESTDFNAEDHFSAISRHVKVKLIDHIIVNNAPIPESLLSKYQSEGARPVRADRESLEAMGVKVISEPIISQADHVRHDGEKLASAIFDLWLKNRGGGTEEILV